MPKLPPFPPWKRAPETETMLEEITKLRAEYYEKHPPLPSPPLPWEARNIPEKIAEGIMLAPFAILLSPVIIAMTIKEELIDPRLQSTEEIRSTLNYWRELSGEGE